MGRKKKEETREEFSTYLVNKFEDYQNHIKAGLKLNPMEKAMAIKLLTDDWVFYLQHRINMPDEWSIGTQTYFVADFYIPSMKLVIETDGKIHQTDKVKDKDKTKDNVLASLGYRVMRFSWDEVMDNNDFDVLNYLWELGKNTIKEGQDGKNDIQSIII